MGDFSKYVLAMYDVRGKQEFIYRSNSLKEIVGGSWIIRDIYDDYLLGKSNDGECKIVGDDKPFSIKNFEDSMDDISQKKDGEIVYRGGGNFLVLFRDEDALKRINRYFTKKILQEIGTLNVLCSYIVGIDPDNYREDSRKLYHQHAIDEGRYPVLMPCNALPVVQVDHMTSMPMTNENPNPMSSNDRYVTKENYQKLMKFRNSVKDEKRNDEKFFDEMVTDKGEESLLAVIYFDGNGMGAKVENCLNDSTEIDSKTGSFVKAPYDECIPALREFSKNLQKEYVTDRLTAIDRMLDKKGKKQKKTKHRAVVYAGDEMTLVCNAHDVINVLKAYFDSNDCSSCAGAAIFHSHAPYSEAYRIAEECCENGKKYMKKHQMKDACLFDFYYCQGGIGSSLDKIREKENGTLFSTPWFIKISEEEKKNLNNANFNHDTAGQTVIDFSAVEEMVAVLNNLGRSNVKGLLNAVREGASSYLLEIERINAHRKDKEHLDFSLDKKLSLTEQRKLIFDIVTVYDLWFADKEDYVNA